MESSSKEKEIFNQMSEIDISNYTKSKHGLTYLSWARAWEILKKKYPTAKFEVIYNEKTQMPYFSDTAGAIVRTRISIDEYSCDSFLPVLNHKNQAITAESIDVFLVNKSIMRCLVKNIALMTGLGLNLYVGEDAPAFNDDKQSIEDELKEEIFQAATIESLQKVVNDLAKKYKTEIPLIKSLATKRKEEIFSSSVDKKEVFLSDSDFEKFVKENNASFGYLWLDVQTIEKETGLKFNNEQKGVITTFLDKNQDNDQI
jgi:hypothetical protein